MGLDGVPFLELDMEAEQSPWLIPFRNVSASSECWRAASIASLVAGSSEMATTSPRINPCSSRLTVAGVTSTVSLSSIFLPFSRRHEDDRVVGRTGVVDPSLLLGGMKQDDGRPLADQLVRGTQELSNFAPCVADNSRSPLQLVAVQSSFVSSSLIFNWRSS